MTAALAGMQKRLLVHLDRGPALGSMKIGECAWSQSRRALAFEWSEEALDAGLELSPVLMPLGAGVSYAKQDPFFGVPGLLSDSIPDGFGLRLMNKGLIAAGHDLAKITPLHRLAWVGERGVGALSYKPALDAKGAALLVSLQQAAGLAAQAESENLAGMPKQAIRAGGSALGARPKFWGMLDPDGSKVLLGDSVSAPKGFKPILLKFAPTGGDKNEPYLEAACLELANRHGVKAARAQVLEFPGGAGLAMERFDRLASGERAHIQSVAALLGLNFREPTLSYESLGKLAVMLGGATEGERLYRQLCFNVALSMRDDHAKNFAFRMSSEGQWGLTPAFDLCPSAGFGMTPEHTTTLNGKGQGVTRADLTAFARALNLPTRVANSGIDNARAAALEFEALATHIGATRKSAQQWGKAFKEIDVDLRPAAIAIKGSPLTKGRLPKE